MISIPRACPRGRSDCIALSNLVSDDGSSFFCAGENNSEAPPCKLDRFTLCCKSIEGRDDMVFLDKRDMHHQASVIVQSLAVVEKDYTEERDWSPWGDDGK